jgi:hypothetical protein
MERRFTRAWDEQEKRRRLQELLTRRDSLVAEAKLQIERCDKAATVVSSITSAIYNERSLGDVFTSAKRSGGQLFFERVLSKEERAISQERFAREAVGRIDGIEAATAQCPSTLIRAKVSAALEGVTEESISGWKGSQLDKKSLQFNEVSDLMLRAGEYVRSCERFSRPENWTAFEKLFEPGRYKASDRARRILKRMAHGQFP